jgi:hypothetical protein
MWAEEPERSDEGALPLRPVPDGKGYRVVAPGARVEVTPRLAAELQRVLERFAADAGFDGQRPVDVLFKPGIFGHHRVGRAADIYGVGAGALDAWKARWDEARRRGLATDGNLGWRLYVTLARHGRWSQPYGYPIQLFGPWTRVEGPWKYISDRLLQAHRDHIHVAK